MSSFKYEIMVRHYNDDIDHNNWGTKAIGLDLLASRGSHWHRGKGYQDKFSTHRKV